MDIIIRTGFESIKHKIHFQPQTEQKGKKLVLAQHVREVEELRTNGKSFLIRARIIRQTSVTQTPYKTSLNATSTPARPVTAPAPASSRPAKAVAGGATRPDTPSHARPGSAPATALKKTPTNVPKPTTPPIGTKADLQGNVEKITKPRVPPQKVDDQTTPRLPTTYADKIKRITNWQLAAKLIPKEPRLTKQKSLDSIQLSQPKPSTSRSQDTLQLISFDRSARTVSPSNLKPTAPTPFPSIHRQEEQDEAAKTRESRKRQLEADETTATQPARPKMQPPAIPTIVTTPPDTLQPQDRQPRVPPEENAGEAKGKERRRPVLP
ncbi:hypothetical protein ACJJTC_013682 [Scirpophaga incertulas]